MTGRKHIIGYRSKVIGRANRQIVSIGIR